MDTELVRAFIVVAQNLSFTRAAEQLGTTQPMLSRAMRRLEDIIGEELFDRSKRQIALTPSGAAFLDEAQGVLDRLSLAFRRAQLAGQGSPAALRVGYMSYMRMPSIHRGIRRFRAQHPQVTLDLRMMQAHDQANALRSGELDVGLMIFNRSDRRGLTWRTISREGYVLALPSNWIDGPLHAVDLADLRDRPFLLPDPDLSPEIHAAGLACCHQAGFEPKVAGYIREGGELQFLIAAGLGAGFAFSSALQTAAEGIRFAPIRPASAYSVDAHVVWAADRTPPLARVLIDCVAAEASAAVLLESDQGVAVEWRPMAGPS